MTRARNYERESIVIAVEIIGSLVTFRPLHLLRERYEIRGWKKKKKKVVLRKEPPQKGSRESTNAR